MKPHLLNRRQLIQHGTAGVAALGAWSALSNRVVERALARSSCGNLDQVEHIVILIQENRSFDCYFGGYRAVTGFQDPNAPLLNDGSGLTVFAQPGYPNGFDSDHLYPFHLDTTNGGECTNDIDNSWASQHPYWDGGAMDGFVKQHIAVDGAVNGPLTMGYYTRKDLPFYYALADAFTLCDHYHCSVLGPTDPNRCYSMSASIDPDGTNGGPIVSTLTTNRVQTYGAFTWQTMPEVLQSCGISWKVYQSPENVSPVSDNVLLYFKAYQENAQLATGAFGNFFPAAFLADCEAGTLPQVSWVVGPVIASEHPPTPVTYGELVTAQVLNALVSNPSIWETTALFVTYDENGGYFDHVPPPTAPSGTAGEWLTATPPTGGEAGIAGPIGLGFRVPMHIVSPFSNGGYVCTETFDHSSTLKFLATRFAAEGVSVPNLSAWRNSTVGDLTGAFNFASPGNPSVPTLPQPSAADARVLTSQSCQTAAVAYGDPSAPGVPDYPVTVNSSVPAQEPGTAPAPSGC